MKAIMQSKVKTRIIFDLLFENIRYIKGTHLFNTRKNLLTAKVQTFYRIPALFRHSLNCQGCPRACGSIAR